MSRSEGVARRGETSGARRRMRSRSRRAGIDPYGAAGMMRTAAGTDETDKLNAAFWRQVRPDTMPARAGRLVRAVATLVLVHYVPGSAGWLFWFLVRWLCWFGLLVWLTGLGGWAW